MENVQGTCERVSLRARTLHGRRSMTLARSSSLVIALSLIGSATIAQTPRESLSATARARFDTAFFAWERGDYPAAFTGLERLLASPDGERMLEPIALLSGELYRAIPVATDGQTPRWSADGSFASFTTNGGRVTHIVAVERDTVRPVVSIAGVSLAFSPMGDRVAYLAIDETPELRAARALADSLLRAQEFGRLQRQRQEVTRLEQETARIMVRDLRSGATEEMAAPGLAKRGLVFGADGAMLYVVGGPPSDRAHTDIHALSSSATPRAVSSGPGLKANPIFTTGGRYLVYTL